MKPPARHVVARSSENEKRRLADPLPDTTFLQDLASQVCYEGSGKHKEHPRAFGLEPAPRAADDTLCDGHAGFQPSDMASIPGYLRRGILAGLIGHNLRYGTTPTILWTVWDSGWVYEARITNAAQYLYHGYPLLSGDAFARQVIARYADWVYRQPNSTSFLLSLRQAQGRYR